MADFVPAKLFRSLSNASLKGIFDQFHIEMAIDWENRKQNEPEEIVKAWAFVKAGPNGDASIGDVHDLFQNIASIAEAKTDSSRIAEEQVRNAKRDDVKLPSNFMEMNRYEQAAHIYLHLKGIWNAVSCIVLAEDMSYTRHWIEYCDLPKQDTDFSSDAIIARLRSAVTDFFHEEKKCQNCIIDYYPMYNELYYFFATLDDSPKFIEMKKPGEETYGMNPAIMPFRIIFAYNYVEGEFSLFADVATKDKLAAKLIEALLGHPEKTVRLRASFSLGKLNQRGFTFPPAPETHISHGRVKSLTIVPMSNATTEITFKDRSRDVYDCKAEYLDKSRLPENACIAKKATITMQVDDPALSFKSLTFDISEKTCNLKSQPESKRKLGEALLKFWGFKNAGND